MTRRVVEKGEEILRCRKAGSGYFRAPAEVTGLYIGPEEAILTKEELQIALSVIVEREQAAWDEEVAQRHALATKLYADDGTLNAGCGPEDFPGEDFPSDKPLPWPHNPGDPEAA